jgi:hypothetical protein
VTATSPASSATSSGRRNAPQKPISDFRPIAECSTLDEARLAALQAGDDVRGRIYIGKMVRGERGAMGSPIFGGYKSELQAGLRIPVQSAVSGNTRARRAG